MERRTLPALLRAIDHFERAIQRDSTFAGAWSGLADARMVLTTYGHDQSDSLPARVLADAERALALDPGLAEAHASLGQLHDWFLFDAPTAHAELATAIERNPSYAAAHQWMGNLEGSRGRREEALDHIRRAAELDPFSSIIQLVLGWTYWWVEGPGTNALFHIREAQTLAPGSAVAHVDEGLVLSDAGRHDEAVAALERGLGLAAEKTLEWHLAVAGLGVAHARIGDTDRARAELTRLRESEGSQFFQALIQAAMGDVEGAFLALEAVEWTRVLKWDLHVFPSLDVLREDPRYARLVEHTNEMWGLRADGSLPRDER
jgi:tetratricopeptide (TPR) repeat protein